MAPSDELAKLFILNTSSLCAAGELGQSTCNLLACVKMPAGHRVAAMVGGEAMSGGLKRKLDQLGDLGWDNPILQQISTRLLVARRRIGRSDEFVVISVAERMRAGEAALCRRK